MKQQPPTEPPLPLDKRGRKHAGGRTAVKIDMAQLEALCHAQCTLDEVAAFFKVCEKVIQRRRKSAAFLEVMDRGYAGGRSTLRRAQMKAALAGNATMLIWLGKQLLGQRDHLEHTGPGGGPIEIKEIKVSFITPALPTS